MHWMKKKRERLSPLCEKILLQLRKKEDKVYRQSHQSNVHHQNGHSVYDRQKEEICRVISVTGAAN